MRFTPHVRNLSLGIAAASFLLAGSLHAQSQSQKKYDVIGVNARLEHSLNSKDAKAGEIVVAKTDHAAKTPEGVDLPKGTELIGRVERAEASQNGGPSSITLVFNKARLNDGKEVPVKVVILGAFPATEAMMAQYGDETMGPAPRHVSSHERVLQEPGLLNHIAMRSAVHSHNSGTFTKKDGDFTLDRGTYLQIGIAPLAWNNQQAA